jgi:hypothetical protein
MQAGGIVFYGRGKRLHRPDHPSPLKGSFRCPLWQIGPNQETVAISPSQPSQFAVTIAVRSW